MKKFKFTIRGNEYEVHINSFEDNIAEIDVNGSTYKVELEEQVKTTKTPKLVRPKPVQTKESKPTPAAGFSKIQAPLPGTVFKLNVKEGDDVKKGEIIMILEAMKMENALTAPAAGTVKAVNCESGDNVGKGDLLVVIE